MEFHSRKHPHLNLLGDLNPYWIRKRCSHRERQWPGTCNRPLNKLNVLPVGAAVGLLFHKKTTHFPKIMKHNVFCLSESP